MGCSERVIIPACSNSSEQDQDQENDNDKAQSAAAVIASPIERAAAKSAKPSKQDDDQDYDQYGSDRHGNTPQVSMMAGFKKEPRFRARLLIRQYENIPMSVCPGGTETVPPNNSASREKFHRLQLLQLLGQP
jgi:hypothetical protein